MKYCHECGSEVADNDLFCPYCGISQPTPDEAVPTDDPLASTIVISAQPTPETPQLSERLVDPYISDASLSVATLETEESIRIEVAEEAHPYVSDVIEEGDETGSVKDDSLSRTAQVTFEGGREQSANLSDIPVPTLLTEQQPSSNIEEPPTVAPAIDGETEDPEHFRSERLVLDSVENDQRDDFGTDVRVEVTKEESDDLYLAAIPSEAQIESSAEDIHPEKEQVDVSPTASDRSATAAGDEGAESLVKAEDEVSSVAEDRPEVLSLDVSSSPSDYSSSDIDQAESVEPVSNDLVPQLEKAAEPAALFTSFEESVSSEDLENKSYVSSGSEPAVVDTGEGLKDEKSASQTTPRIGSADTDGRKSGLKPLPEGTILNNRYDIVRKIGGGGMGAVYLATDRNLGGVTRAVKEMVQSHIEEEQQEKAIDDFKRESMILSTLDHPSIPTIYDYFFDEQESRFYLVMKYISGGDLAGRLRAAPEGRIDERTVVEWALQIIDVLDYLHNLPTTIVYRDLKPSNIMIDGSSGRTMLIDFGIARSIDQNQEKGVTAVGTMGYAPPELFSGNVEPRSDIYSLGSTMFHLLTGADPQNNPLLIFDFQKNPRPRQINPQLSDQIERILMRSVEYNADARFSSAAEMKRALSDHLEGLKIGQITFGVTEVPQSVSLSNQVVFCGFCGQRIVATDMFCAFCGSKQPLAQHGVHSEVYSSRSNGTAKLVLVGTSELDSPAYGIEKQENLVGRRDPMSNIFPEVDLSKYDPQTKISRRHAKIWRDGQKYLVEDLGSSNGTILLTSINDAMRLIPHEPHPLASGDRLRVGDTTLHFIIG